MGWMGVCEIAVVVVIGEEVERDLGCGIGSLVRLVIGIGSCVCVCDCEGCCCCCCSMHFSSGSYMYHLITPDWPFRSDPMGHLPCL